MPCDLILNCLPMADPHARTQHLGYAEEVIAPLFEVHRTLVLDMLQQVASLLATARRDGLEYVNICIFCKSGRHRALEQ